MQPKTEPEEPEKTWKVQTGVKKELSMKEEIAAAVAAAVKEERETMAVPVGPDGICRVKGPWGVKARCNDDRAHLQNNLRQQKIPGQGWITEQGEKVWTNAQTGQTFQSPGCFYQ